MRMGASVRQLLAVISEPRGARTARALAAYREVLMNLTPENFRLDLARPPNYASGVTAARLRRVVLCIRVRPYICNCPAQSSVERANRAVTGIGLPLAAVSACLCIVILALGLLDFAIMIGLTCARLVGKDKRASLLWRIAVLAAGLVVLSVFALIPGLGALILLIAFAMGTGAVLLQGVAMRTEKGMSP